MISKFRPRVRSCVLLILVSSLLAGQVTAKSTPHATRAAALETERSEAADDLAAGQREVAAGHQLADGRDLVAQLGVGPRAIPVDERRSVVLEERPQMTIPPSTPSTWPVT